PRHGLQARSVIESPQPTRHSNVGDEHPTVWCQRNAVGDELAALDLRMVADDGHVAVAIDVADAGTFVRYEQIVGVKSQDALRSVETLSPGPHLGSLDAHVAQHRAGVRRNVAAYMSAASLASLPKTNPNVTTVTSV